MIGLVYWAFQLFLIASMAVAAVIDLRTMRIPNALVGVQVFFWLLRQGCLLAAISFLPSNLAFSQWLALTIEGVAGSLLLGGGVLLFTLAFEHIAKRGAMGGGDIKLLFAVGLWFGPHRGLLCLLMACVAFVVLSAVLPHLGWMRPQQETPSDKTAFPFAPGIAIGSLAMSFL